jgi:hypothetical protein
MNRIPRWRASIASNSACENPPPPQLLFVATMFTPRSFMRAT